MIYLLMTYWVLLSYKGDSNDDDIKGEGQEQKRACITIITIIITIIITCITIMVNWAASLPSFLCTVVLTKKITLEESTTITGNDKNHQEP